ncbi:hypothetical protein JCM3775_005562 [Rhodotorula graminis]
MSPTGRTSRPVLLKDDWPAFESTLLAAKSVADIQRAVWFYMIRPEKADLPDGYDQDDCRVVGFVNRYLHYSVRSAPRLADPFDHRDESSIIQILAEHYIPDEALAFYGRDRLFGHAPMTISRKANQQYDPVVPQPRAVGWRTKKIKAAQQQTRLWAPPPPPPPPPIHALVAPLRGQGDALPPVVESQEAKALELELARRCVEDTDTRKKAVSSVVKTFVQLVLDGLPEGLITPESKADLEKAAERIFTRIAEQQVDVPMKPLVEGMVIRMTMCARAPLDWATARQLVDSKPVESLPARVRDAFKRSDGARSDGKTRTTYLLDFHVLDKAAVEKRLEAAEQLQAEAPTASRGKVLVEQKLLLRRGHLATVGVTGVGVDSRSTGCSPLSTTALGTLNGFDEQRVVVKSVDAAKQAIKIAKSNAAKFKKEKEKREKEESDDEAERRNLRAAEKSLPTSITNSATDVFSLLMSAEQVVGATSLTSSGERVFSKTYLVKFGGGGSPYSTTLINEDGSVLARRTPLVPLPLAQTSQDWVHSSLEIIDSHLLSTYASPHPPGLLVLPSLDQHGRDLIKQHGSSPEMVIPAALCRPVIDTGKQTTLASHLLNSPSQPFYDIVAPTPVEFVDVWGDKGMTTSYESAYAKVPSKVQHTFRSVVKTKFRSLDTGKGLPIVIMLANQVESVLARELRKTPHLAVHRPGEGVRHVMLGSVVVPVMAAQQPNYIVYRNESDFRLGNTILWALATIFPAWTEKHLQSNSAPDRLAVIAGFNHTFEREFKLAAYLFNRKTLKRRDYPISASFPTEWVTVDIRPRPHGDLTPQNVWIPVVHRHGLENVIYRDLGVRQVNIIEGEGKKQKKRQGYSQVFTGRLTLRLTVTDVDDVDEARTVVEVRGPIQLSQINERHMGDLDPQTLEDLRTAVKRINKDGRGLLPVISDGRVKVKYAPLDGTSYYRSGLLHLFQHPIIPYDRDNGELDGADDDGTSLSLSSGGDTAAIERIKKLEEQLERWNATLAELRA